MQIAPDFTLLDQNETPRSLQEFRGGWVVLYFYPKDDTPGCTKEACAFRDNWSEFQKRGIAVLGVSADSPRKHRNFIKKYELPFILLSDPEKSVIKTYNSWGWKKFMGREFEGILRQTFLINPRGEIVKEYPKVTPAEHAGEILRDVADF